MISAEPILQPIAVLSGGLDANAVVDYLGSTYSWGPP